MIDKKLVTALLFFLPCWFLYVQPSPHDVVFKLVGTLILAFLCASTAIAIHGVDHD